jgi:hypothetical protein
MLPAKFDSIWARSFREEDVFNISQSEKNNFSWRPYVFADWNQMKMLNRGSCIDASCQVGFNLAYEFQRRKFV